VLVHPELLITLVWGYPVFSTGILQLSDAVGEMKAVVGSGGLHPSGGIEAVPDTVGLILSDTVNVVLQELVHPLAFVIVSVKVNVPHEDPLKTDTALLMVEPLMVPLPEMDQV
jgi:hypothetical protein